LRREIYHYDPAANREAIAILRDKFLVATDEVARLGLASSLVTLGQKDDIYWSVLATRAKEIIDSTAPDPFVYDEKGHIRKPIFGENNIPIPGALSPEFLQWAKSNNKAVVDAFQELTGDLPAQLALLASTGDPRGLFILRKGLYSPNLSVEWVSAWGLARLQDKDSITKIIEDARKAPEDAKWPIARALLFFNDLTASAAAEEVITDKNVLANDKKTARAQGVFGIW
jgi:hypothetical protein